MYSDLVDKWLLSQYIDEEHKKEIRSLGEKELEDRFYKELEFGTGGLRGVIGSGTNRINIYTVGKVTKGYAGFLNNKYKGENISVAIAYDSRIKSDEFAKRAALILAANNIKVYLYESLRPTPMLSFALRELGCKGGIVITASHNPKEYNGYKVYGDDGGQLTDVLAREVYSFINKVNIFESIDFFSEEEAISCKKLEYIGQKIDKIYIEKVKETVIRKDLVKNNANDLKIIYTPIHGAGYEPILRLLSEQGYGNLKIVEEQRLPNGHFPTVSYPNPEIKEVFDIALKYTENFEADIICATDPDCDRLGIISKDANGEFKLLTGNQIGILLAEYILKSLKEKNELSTHGVLVKTIVTTDAIKNISRSYGVDVIDVLTGFKYIGEKIKEFEEDSNRDFIFGFEESYGYLLGTFVRDKDAVIALNMVAEMSLYYKKLGKTLVCALRDIYNKYGYFSEELISIDLEGKEGQEKISRCIDTLRTSSLKTIGKTNVVKIQDYKLSIETNIVDGKVREIKFPKSNVIKFFCENGWWFVIRPSGTEPKMKIYLSVLASDEKSVKYNLDIFKKDVLDIIESIE